MQNELKSKPEQGTQPRRQLTEEERRKRREYDREYQKKNRAKLSQRQRERRAEQRAERAKNKPVEEPKKPEPIKSAPKPLIPPKKVGIKGEPVKRSRIKEKRVLAVDIPKPINETLIKKLGWIMSEERKYVLSEVMFGITPSKKASDIRDALEYFERVLFTADQMEVFGTKLRKLVEFSSCRVMKPTLTLAPSGSLVFSPQATRLRAITRARISARNFFMLVCSSFYILISGERRKNFRIPEKRVSTRNSLFNDI